MSSKNPLVSVIMPVFNAEVTVKRAALSILQQSYSNFEFIIIDDGSTDRSVEILEALNDKRIKLIKNRDNRGVVSVLNDALRIASGELIARQDADDESLKVRLQRQVLALLEDSSLIALGAALHIVDDQGFRNGIWRYPESAEFSEWQIMFKTPIAHSVSMYWKEPVLAAGGYSEKYKFAEDYHLWSRLVTSGGIRSLRVPLLRYSVGSSGISRKRIQEQREIHCQIARENIRKITGVEFSIETVFKLCFISDNADVRIEHGDVIQVADGLSNILERFAKAGISRKSKTAVSRDCTDRIVRAIRRLPRRMRWEIIRRIKRDSHLYKFGVIDVAKCMR